MSPAVSATAGCIRSYVCKRTDVLVISQEIGIVTATNKQFVNATNNVVYELTTANGGFQISKVDVWADQALYATAFCSGSVTCSA
jgi:hypothetical protein